MSETVNSSLDHITNTCNIILATSAIIKDQDKETMLLLLNNLQQFTEYLYKSINHTIKMVEAL